MSEGAGSEVQERFGPFVALLGAGDVGQRAIIQVVQLLTRAPAFAQRTRVATRAGHTCNHRDCPGGAKKRRAYSVKDWVMRHLFLSLIHSFQRQDSDVASERKRKRYECCKYHLSHDTGAH
jgi:hypothetical protein